MVGDGNPMTIVLLASWPAGHRRRLRDDRIWYSDQCVQPGQHADYSGHDRGRERSDPDRAGRRARSIAADRRSAQGTRPVGARAGQCGEARAADRANDAGSAAGAGRAPAPPMPDDAPPSRQSTGAAACPDPPPRPSRRGPEPPYAPEPRFPATASEPAARSARLVACKIQACATPCHLAGAAGHGRTADGRTDRRSAAVAALAAAADDAAGGRSRRREPKVWSPSRRSARGDAGAPIRTADAARHAAGRAAARKREVRSGMAGSRRAACARPARAAEESEARARARYAAAANSGAPAREPASRRRHAADLRKPPPSAGPRS